MKVIHKSDGTILKAVRKRHFDDRDLTINIPYEVFELDADVNKDVAKSLLLRPWENPEMVDASVYTVVGGELLKDGQPG